MPSGYVEQGAVVGGFAAEVLDALLSRHLPSYLSAMTPEGRADVDAAHAALHRAAVRSLERAAASSAGGTAEPVVAELPSRLGHADEVTTVQAAAMLGVSDRQVRKLAAAWEGDGLARTVGRTWLIDRVAVVAHQGRERRTA